MKALVIPVEGPLCEIELAAENDDLDTLQRAVGGFIQALPLPGFVDPTGSWRSSIRSATAPSERR
jgi:hypothetical protein